MSVIVMTFCGLAALGLWLWACGTVMAHRPGPDEPKVEAGQSLIVEGEHIHYVRRGTGPTVLLLHGLGASIYSYRFLIEDLSRDYDILAIDLLGFGQSSKPTHVSYGLAEQTARVRQVLERLGVDRCRVIGSSMGATIGLWLAHSDPQRVRDLFLLAPATSPKLVKISGHRLLKYLGLIQLICRAWTMVYVLMLVFSDWRKIHRQSVEQALRPLSASGNGLTTLLLATQAFSHPGLPKVFADVTLPIHLIWGEQDRMVPLKYAAELKAILPNAELELISGCGHHPHEEKPHEVLSAFRRFNCSH